MPSVAVTLTVAEGSEALAVSQTYTADGWKKADVVVAPGAVDALVALAFDKDNVKVVTISSDQNVTIETNSGAAPADTLTILAGVPFVQRHDDYRANAFTVDVTALYITNAGASTANVKIRVLEDLTP